MNSSLQQLVSYVTLVENCHSGVLYIGHGNLNILIKYIICFKYVYKRYKLKVNLRGCYLSIVSFFNEIKERNKHT